jgi:2-keto-3-deoxy-L-rhamnonate aldolase RhmA
MTTFILSRLMLDEDRKLGFKWSAVDEQYSDPVLAFPPAGLDPVTVPVHHKSHTEAEIEKSISQLAENTAAVEVHTTRAIVSSREVKKALDSVH